MALDFFKNQIYDAGSLKYSLDGGLFKPTGVQGFTLEIGAEAEYYFEHGRRGPKDVTNTKFAPAGTLIMLIADYKALHEYLWNSGGSALPGGSSEYASTFSTTLSGNRPMSVVLGNCHFYAQQLIDGGEGGSITPIKTTLNLKFNSVKLDGIPFWQDPDSPDLAQ